MKKQIAGYQWVAAGLACVAWTSTAIAGDATVSTGTTVQPAPTAGNAVQSAPTAGASAKRVYRDKQTGKLRAPTEEELKEMLDDERAGRAARGQPETGPVAPLVVRTYPNGMRSAVLGPEYLVTIKGKRRPDGTLTVTHDRAGHDHAAPQTDRPTK